MSERQSDEQRLARAVRSRAENPLPPEGASGPVVAWVTLADFHWLVGEAEARAKAEGERDAVVEEWVYWNHRAERAEVSLATANEAQAKAEREADNEPHKLCRRCRTARLWQRGPPSNEHYSGHYYSGRCSDCGRGHDEAGRLALVLPTATTEQEQFHCANCGMPRGRARQVIGLGDGEWACSARCQEQLETLGCPFEHGEYYRHPLETAEWQQRLAAANEARAKAEGEAREQSEAVQRDWLCPAVAEGLRRELAKYHEMASTYAAEAETAEPDLLAACEACERIFIKGTAAISAEEWDETAGMVFDAVKAARGQGPKGELSTVRQAGQVLAATEGYETGDEEAGMSVCGRIIRLSEFTAFCARCDESESWAPPSRRAHTEFVRAIREHGWRKRKAGWTCPSCCKGEAKG